MERKIITLPCTALIGGVSFVQTMSANISGTKNKLILELEVMNLHSRKLVALDYEIDFFNSISEKLNNEKIVVNKKNISVNKGEIENVDKFKILTEYSEARMAQITLVRGYFDDGKALDLIYEKAEAVEFLVLDKKQKTLLKDIAGKDAYSLAQQKNLSWRCVCGYFNDKSSLLCGNCERDKKDVISKFSSIDILIPDSKSEAKNIESEVKKEKENELKVIKIKKENKMKEFIKSLNNLLKKIDKKTKRLLLGSITLMVVSLLIWLVGFFQ